MTQTAVAVAPPAVNTPAARLLDMLIGWAEWVARQESVTDVEEGETPFRDPLLSSEELYDLYQQAGEAVMGLHEEDGQAERQVVTSFLVHEVLPILLRTPVEARRQAAA